jgi:superfamily I DNA and RNA helicase
MVPPRAGLALAGSRAPQLEGDARAAVLHRSSHMQIIASAGSGKTEVVAQRFAQLMADGADAAAIIAFTFTKRAADELKAAFPPVSRNGSAPPRLTRSVRRSSGRSTPTASGFSSSMCRL